MFKVSAETHHDLMGGIESLCELGMYLHNKIIIKTGFSIAIQLNHISIAAYYSFQTCKHLFLLLLKPLNLFKNQSKYLILVCIRTSQFPIKYNIIILRAFLSLPVLVF